MGHIINASAFRLGKTQRTSSIWVKKNPYYKSFFLKDFYIARFIKNFFITYNIPVFSSLHIRAKNTGKDDLFENPWINQGFVFSNCIITRTQILHIHSFFLDSLLEEIRTKYIYSVKANTYLLFKKYQKRNWAHSPYDYFYKNKLWKWRNWKKKKKNKLFYLRKKAYYYFKKQRRLIMRLKFKKKYKKQKHYAYNSSYPQKFSFQKYRKYNSSYSQKFSFQKYRKYNSSYPQKFSFEKYRKYNSSYPQKFSFENYRKYNNKRKGIIPFKEFRQKKNIPVVKKCLSRKSLQTLFSHKHVFFTKKKVLNRIFSFFRKLKKNTKTKKIKLIHGSRLKKNTKTKKIKLIKGSRLKKKAFKKIRYNKLYGNLCTKLKFTKIRKKKVTFNKFDKKEYKLKTLKLINKIYIKAFKKRRNSFITIKRRKRINLKKLIYKFILRNNHTLIPFARRKARKKYYNKTYNKNKNKARKNYFRETLYIKKAPKKTINKFSFKAQQRISNKGIYKNKKRIIEKKMLIQNNEMRQQNYSRILKNKELNKVINKKKLIIKKIVKTYPYALNKIQRKILKQKSLPFFAKKKILKILKILLLIFKREINSWKKQYFTIILFKQLINKIQILFKNQFNLNFFKILNIITIKEMALKHYHTQFFKKIFKMRYFIFQNATSILTNGLYSLEGTTNLALLYSSLHTHHLTANQICNYITIKLGQYFKLFEILQPILRSLRTARNIAGFRLLIVGRLTRKERAAHLIRRHGRIPLASKNIKIDYAADYKIMRFGVVGVKIWLHLKNLHPYFYTFRFGATK